MDENSPLLDQIPERIYNNVSTVNNFLMDYIQHFDGMQTKLRGMAITWLLATFAGAGFFISSHSTGIPFDALLGMTLLFLAGLISITPLFVLDRLVYQKFLDAVFLTGVVLEQNYPWLPQMRHNILSVHRKKGLSSLLSRFYFGCFCILCGSADVSFALWLSKTSLVESIASLFMGFIIIYGIIKSLHSRLSTHEVKSCSIQESLHSVDEATFKRVWENHVHIIEILKFYGENLSSLKRLLSSCLLAIFIAIGFVFSSEDVALFSERLIVVPFICLVGNCGVTLIWMIDLLGYQKVVHTIFSEGVKLEQSHPWLPSFYESIMKALPGDTVAVYMAGLYIYCNVILLLIGGVSLASWCYAFSPVLSIAIAIIYAAIIGFCSWFFTSKSRISSS